MRSQTNICFKGHMKGFLDQDSFVSLRVHSIICPCTLRGVVLVEVALR